MPDSDWASLPDEQLLGVRMSDLDLTIEGTEIEQRIRRFVRERTTNERCCCTRLPKNS